MDKRDAQKAELAHLVENLEAKRFADEKDEIRLRIHMRFLVTELDQLGNEVYDRGAEGLVARARLALGVT